MGTYRFQKGPASVYRQGTIITGFGHWHFHRMERCLQVVMKTGHSACGVWQTARCFLHPQHIRHGSPQSHFQPDGKILASGGNEIFFWDTATGTQLRPNRRKLSAQISFLVFSPDGSTLVAGNWDGILEFVGCSHRWTIVHSYGTHTVDQRAEIFPRWENTR